MILKKLDIHMQNKEKALNHTLHHIHNNLKSIKEPILKPKTIKLLEKI